MKCARVIVEDLDDDHVRIVRFENLVSKQEVPSLYLSIHPHMFLTPTGLMICHNKYVGGLVPYGYNLNKSSLNDLIDIMEQCGDNLTEINKHIGNLEQTKKFRSIKI
jgi:hypothetical protein